MTWNHAGAAAAIVAEFEKQAPGYGISVSPITTTDNKLDGDYYPSGARLTYEGHNFDVFWFQGEAVYRVFFPDGSWVPVMANATEAAKHILHLAKERAGTRPSEM